MLSFVPIAGVWYLWWLQVNACLCATTASETGKVSAAWKETVPQNIWLFGFIPNQSEVTQPGSISKFRGSPSPRQASRLGALASETPGFLQPPPWAAATWPLPESCIWEAWGGRKQSQAQTGWHKVRWVLPPPSLDCLRILSKSNYFSEGLVCWDLLLGWNTSPQQVLRPAPATLVGSLPHLMSPSHQLPQLCRPLSTVVFSCRAGIALPF